MNGVLDCAIVWTIARISERIHTERSAPVWNVDLCTIEVLILLGTIFFLS